MPSLPSDVSSPARGPALIAFLRGIELRGWVFALRQCGNEVRAEHGLAAALRDFLREAPALPLAAWPIRFWSCLLRQPALMTPAEPDAPGLAGLAPGPRAAILLRLVAGLDLAHAAEALGVPQASYERALQRAIGAPGLDREGVEALRESLQVQIHDAPAAQKRLLAAWRDEAVLASEDVPVPASLLAPTSRPRGLRLLAVLSALALALAVLLWFLPNPFWPTRAPVQVIDKVAPPPAMDDAVVVTHPDYLQLAKAGEEPVYRELAFFSWMAAEAAAPASSASAAPAISASVAPPLSIEVPEDETPAAASFDALTGEQQVLLTSARSAWNDLDAPTRRALALQAHDWITRDPAQREELRTALLAWDRQSAPERARRRTPFLAWQRLGASEQAQAAAAEAAYAALAPAMQQQLRAQFAALPPDNQALWWLGPRLGRELAPFASLFAYLPESERPGLLLVLRELEPGARADLALLAPRLGEARRQSLRRELIAAPAAQRSELIRARLAESSAVQ